MNVVYPINVEFKYINTLKTNVCLGFIDRPYNTESVRIGGTVFHFGNSFTPIMGCISSEKHTTNYMNGYAGLNRLFMVQRITNEINYLTSSICVQENTL